MKQESLYAVSWWRRAFNFFIDTAVVITITRFLAEWLITQFAYTRDGFWVVAVFVAVPFVFFLYYFFSEYFFGKTLGKFITKTKVTLLDGTKPTSFGVVARTFLRFVPVDIFTYLGAYPVGWHDEISGVYVTQEGGEKELPSTPEPLTMMSRWWRRFWVLLVFFMMFIGLVVPVFTIYRWDNPVVVSADTTNWANYQLDSGLTLSLPNKAKQMSETLWRSRLVGVQNMEIERFESVEEVKKSLRDEFSLLSETPLLVIEFSVYDEEEDGSGSYRYRLSQAPARGAGFWVTSNSGAVYMIRFLGFGVEVDAAMKEIKASALLD
jgi:uncharacterized RDD family membrane protein YckC